MGSRKVLVLFVKITVKPDDFVLLTFSPTVSPWPSAVVERSLTKLKVQGSKPSWNDRTRDNLSAYLTHHHSWHSKQNHAMLLVWFLVKWKFMLRGHVVLTQVLVGN